MTMAKSSDQVVQDAAQYVRADGLILLLEPDNLRAGCHRHRAFQEAGLQAQ